MSHIEAVIKRSVSGEPSELCELVLLIHTTSHLPLGTDCAHNLWLKSQVNRLKPLSNL